MTIAHSINGTALYGVKTDWQRIPKRRNTDGTIDYQTYALCVLDIEQMEMSAFLIIQALQGRTLSSLITTDIDARNTQREYTGAEIISPVTCRHTGLRAESVRIEIRVDTS